MARLLIALTAFACVALGVGRGVPALRAHHDARADYERHSARVGRAEYIAARSDASYARARAAHGRAGDAALLVALGLVLFGALDRPRIAHPTEPPSRASVPPDEAARLAARAAALRHRAALGLLIDVTLVSAGLALALIDDPESAWRHAMARGAPLTALGGQWVALGRGSTFGLRAAGLGVDRASLARAGVAILALPLAAASAPFTRGRGATWHLRLAGFEVSRRA